LFVRLYIANTQPLLFFRTACFLSIALMNFATMKDAREDGSPPAEGALGPASPLAGGTWKYRPTKRNQSFNTRQPLPGSQSGEISVGPGPSSPAPNLSTMDLGFYREIDTCQKILTAAYVLVLCVSRKLKYIRSQERNICSSCAYQRMLSQGRTSRTREQPKVFILV